MPGVLVRVNDIEATARGPPGFPGEVELVDPAWALHRHGHLVVGHSGKIMRNGLREHMHFMLLRELLHHRDGIALCPTSGH